MTILKKFYAKRTEDDRIVEYYVTAENKDEARKKIYKMSGQWLKVTEK